MYEREREGLRERVCVCEREREREKKRDSVRETQCLQKHRVMMEIHCDDRNTQ